MQQNINKSVAIMILNWNGGKDTLECLESLNNCSYPRDKIDILIADNASKDNSLEILTPKINQMQCQGWRSVNLLPLNRNYGSPGGFNRIYEHINSDVEVLIRLDNDVIVLTDSISNLVDSLYSSPDVGVVGGQSFFYHNNEIPCSGAYYINHLTFKGKLEFAKNIVECDTIIGNLMAIRYEDVKKLEYFFDEKLFIVHDEWEFCLRIKQQLNRKVLFDPRATVYHKGASSTSKVSHIATYFSHRNLILLFKDYGPKGIASTVFYFTILLQVIKIAVFERNRYKISGYTDGFRSKILSLDEIGKLNWKNQ